MEHIHIVVIQLENVTANLVTLETSVVMNVKMSIMHLDLFAGVSFISTGNSGMKCLKKSQFNDIQA